MLRALIAQQKWRSACWGYACTHVHSYFSLVVTTLIMSSPSSFHPLALATRSASDTDGSVHTAPTIAPLSRSFSVSARVSTSAAGGKRATAAGEMRSGNLILLASENWARGELQAEQGCGLRGPQARRHEVGRALASRVALAEKRHVLPRTNANDALSLAERVQVLLRAVVGHERREAADDDAVEPRLGGLHVRLVDPCVADMDGREANRLPCIAGVGHDLLREEGVEGGGSEYGKC